MQRVGIILLASLVLLQRASFTFTMNRTPADQTAMDRITRRLSLMKIEEHNRPQGPKIPSKLKDLCLDYLANSDGIVASILQGSAANQMSASFATMVIEKLDSDTIKACEEEIIRELTNTMIDVVIRVALVHKLAELTSIGKPQKQLAIIHNDSTTPEELKNAIRGLLKMPHMLIPMNSIVHSCAWTSDGVYFATGGPNNIVEIWKQENDNGWQCIATLQGHTSWINSVAWSPDDKYLATGSDDGTIRIWTNIDNEWRCIDSLEKHALGILFVAWSPDSKYLTTGSWDDNARIWTVVANKCLFVALLFGRIGWVHAVSWSPDGKYLATANYHGTVQIWHKSTCIATLEGHTDGIRSVTWSPNGKYLVTGSMDNTIKIWANIDNKWQCIRTLTGHTGAIISITWAPDNKCLVTASDDNTVKIWAEINEKQWKCVMTLPSHTKLNSVSIIAQPHNDNLLAISSLRTVEVWNMRLLQTYR